jgi:hypothetical protein
MRMLFCAAALVFLCSSCASVTQGTTHSLRIETETANGQEVSDADCSLTNDQGTVRVLSGRSSPVRRSSKDLEVTCSSPGLPDASARLVSRANAGLAGNIIIGGGIGALVDHNTGAAYTYPSWVRLVFGQFAVFDRRDEREGSVMAAPGSPISQAAATIVVPPNSPPVGAQERTASVAAASPMLQPAAAVAVPPTSLPVVGQERTINVAAAGVRLHRGDTFDYSVTDRATGRSQVAVLRADRVDATQVTFNSGARVETQDGEVIRIGSAIAGELDMVTPPGGWMAGGRLPRGSWTMEFASTVPGSRVSYDLTANADRERVLRVAAGEFRAIRIELRGWVESRHYPGIPVRARYQASAWFSPELRRVIRFEAQVRTSSLRLDEVAELTRVGRD